MLIMLERLEPQSHKAMLLFSGGFDSTLVALLLKSRNIPTIGLSINYLSRPMKERVLSKQLARDLGFLQYLNLELPMYGSRDLLPLNRDHDYEAWFPYRNVIFFGISASYAMLHNCNLIAAGIKLSDSVDFDDSSPSFFQILDSIIQLSGRPSFSNRLDLFLPLVTNEGIAESLVLEDDQIKDVLSKTWSCWRNGPEPCGDCNPCRSRERFYNRMKLLKAKGVTNE